jgi:formamidopyrimidine-DNA glycosylase
VPELPEVETVRRTLTPVVGATIARVWTSGKPLRLNAAVDRRGLSRVCKGARIDGVRRLGKYLLIDLEERPRSLLVHLGMSGRLRYFQPGDARPPHTHVEWPLVDGRVLRYSDPRRFGQVELVSREDPRKHPSLARLGPDPLCDHIDGAGLREGCRRTRRPIKVALLDQSLVAGIGNIYASEALWEARIHPATPAVRLGPVRCERLARAVRTVLERALDHGGTSLKDFVAADGHSGEHSHYLWVYDREGARCPRAGCSGHIRRQVQQQRATFYCPRCQRA